MPTIIHMLVEVMVPVDAKNAIDQMIVTQTLTAAAESVREVVKARDGVCTVTATIKRVKEPAALATLGDAPETMPVSLP